MKIWDIFLVEGISWILKVTIAILQMNQGKMASLSLEPLVQYIRMIPVRINPNEVIRRAESLKFITADLICKYKEEYNHPSMTQARAFL